MARKYGFASDTVTYFRDSTVENPAGLSLSKETAATALKTDTLVEKYFNAHPIKLDFFTE